MLEGVKVEVCGESQQLLKFLVFDDLGQAGILKTAHLAPAVRFILGIFRRGLNLDALLVHSGLGTEFEEFSFSLKLCGQACQVMLSFKPTVGIKEPGELPSLFDRTSGKMSLGGTDSRKGAAILGGKCL